jgi:3D (Asp-Asp-Asp) domain-containing protein
MFLDKLKQLLQIKNFQNNRIAICTSGALVLAILTTVSAISSHNFVPQAVETLAIAEIEYYEEEAEIVEDEIRTEYEVVDVSVPFQETRRASSTLNAGETNRLQIGANGMRRETYQLTYRDGVRQSRVLVGTEVVREPVTQIIETGGASATLASRGDSDRFRQVIYMEATAYCPGACCGTGTGRTATGMVAQRGVVAVDPRVIPLGTRVFVETVDGNIIYGQAVAADTGGAIRGNKIDLCFPTHQEALNFGRRQVRVFVE